MKRIASLFERLGASGRKALVPFITAGDPSVESTVPIMHALVAGGADLIELGVPFSDPMADGPVIQRSSERALAKGVDTALVFDCVRRFRETDAQTPIVLMGYLNPMEMRGPHAYAAAARDAGVDGVLLVDLPHEEAAPVREALAAEGIALISLAAPTTSAGRLRSLASDSCGYLYYVSLSGVTGAQIGDTAALAARLVEVRSLFGIPVLVGFGIKDATSAAAMAAMADGVVVGSALVEHLSSAGDAEAAAERASAFMAPLREALDALPGEVG